MTNFSVKIDSSSFLNSFGMLHTVLKIFGLSALKHSKTNETVKYEISFLGLIQSFLISLLIIYAFYIQITRFEPTENYFVLTMLHFYVVTSGTLMSVLMIATGVSNTVTFKNMLNNSRYSSVFHVQLTYKDLSLVTLKQLLLSFAFLVSAFTWDFLSTNNALTLSSAINLLIYFLFPVYNSLCISQFHVTLFWLKCLQIRVNKDLSGLLCRKSNRLKNAENSEMRQRVSLEKNSLCDDIRKLRDLSHKVFKVWKRIDLDFSIRNLFLLFHHCALGTLYAYWALRQSFSKRGLSLPFLLNLYRAAFMSCVSLIRIIWPCNRAVSEVKKTTIIVNEFLTSTELDPGEVEELRIFSLQLLKERAVFSPHEFFNLSNKILLSMLATVTSYLIILLQYNEASGGTFQEASNSTYSP